MKYVLVVGDGMADNPLPELGGKTPLEYAKTPAMDSLAASGVIGSVKTVPKGLPAGTDTAMLSILGCDPTTHYKGRAPLEAAAGNIRLSPGDIAYRCNMITIEDASKPFEELKVLSHSAAGIDGETSDMLVRELFENPEFKEVARAAGMEIFPGGSFRHIAVQRAVGAAKNTGDNQLTLAAPHDHLGKKIGSLLPKTGDNAGVLVTLMRMAHDYLNNHPLNVTRRSEGKLPANGIWFWANGAATALPSFCAKYGKKAAVISAVPLCRGMGKLMGFYVIEVPGATGELHTNYKGKADAAVKALKKDDFVLVHIEAPDECSHEGDLKSKLQAIKWVDSRIVAPLVRKLSNKKEPFRMMVISDHKTFVSTGAHGSDPVPFLIYDSRRDLIDESTAGADVTFCEKSAAQGKLVKKGTQLMDMLFEEDK